MLAGDRIISRSEAEAIKGMIFNVQKYSIHDGPGIRTTVFLNACPLHCLWCQNPESQKLAPTIFFYRDKCTGCGRCVEVCPEGAIEVHEGFSRTTRWLCNGCGKCADACPNDARSLLGRHIAAGEVFREVAEDAIFYVRSGGGMTLSGGEPFAQPRFSIGLLMLCRDSAIHTAIETSGYVNWDIAKQVLKYVDLVLFDFKHMDPVEHQKCTGVSNELILDNAKKVYHELSIPMLARVPIIPGYNDSIENIEATAKFISSDLDKSIKVHLLPYHRLGEAKYERLEMSGNQFSVASPSEEHMAELEKIVKSFGLTAQVGG